MLFLRRRFWLRPDGLSLIICFVERLEADEESGGDDDEREEESGGDVLGECVVGEEKPDMDSPKPELSDGDIIICAIW